MRDELEPEVIPPVASLPGRFVRHILNFFVGLGIGLSPFLGNKNVPGFKALISVMPFQITSSLITLSAFLMGLIVVAVQFYSAERISRSMLRKGFGFAFAAVVVGFILFYVLRDRFTVDVESGESSATVTVLISSFPKKDCRCKNPGPNPEECIKELSLSAPAIASCWDYREIKTRGELLGLSYLILTGGVGVIVGLLLLQEEARRQAAKKKTRTQVKKSTPAGPATPEAPTAAATPAGSEQPAKRAENPEATPEKP